MKFILVLICLYLPAAAMAESAASNTALEGSPHSKYLAAEGTDRFYVRATGDVEYEQSYVIDGNTRSQEVFWHCKSDSLRLGFSSGMMAQPDWESLIAVVEAPVAAGETGSFKMSGMRWTHGQEPMPGQPADSQFKVPRNFEGSSGDLEITLHIATSKTERRIQGVAKGQVKANTSDLVVDLQMEFDLRESCGLLPRQ